MAKQNDEGPDGLRNTLSPVVMSGMMACGAYHGGGTDLASKLSEYRGSRICGVGTNQNHTFGSPFVFDSNPTITSFIHPFKVWAPEPSRICLNLPIAVVNGQYHYEIG